MMTLLNYRLKVTLYVPIPSFADQPTSSGLSPRTACGHPSLTRSILVLRSLCHRNDGRSLIGQMLAFDKHMNLVLAECEEFRKVKVSPPDPTRPPCPEQTT